MSEALLLALLELETSCETFSQLLALDHLGKPRHPRLLVVESDLVSRMIAVQDDAGYEKYIRLNRRTFDLV